MIPLGKQTPESRKPEHEQKEQHYHREERDACETFKKVDSPCRGGQSEKEYVYPQP